MVKQIEIAGNCKHVARHRFMFPDMTEPGFYRQTISYSAFFNAVKRRNRSKEHLFLVQDFSDGDHRSDWEKQRDAALPIHDHAGFHEFLVAIGYDRSLQKFSEEHDIPIPEILGEVKPRIYINTRTLEKVHEVADLIGAKERSTAIFIALITMEALINDDPSFLVKIKEQVDIIDKINTIQRQRKESQPEAAFAN